MRCMVYVANRHYCKPGPCARKDVKTVRWAPTPLRTRVYKLCGTHRSILEANGKIDLGATK